MISERIRIKSVKIADTIPKEGRPNILLASAPTPAAPIVCATVFKAKIADKGLSIFCLFISKVYQTGFWNK